MENKDFDKLCEEVSNQEFLNVEEPKKVEEEPDKKKNLRRKKYGRKY